MHMRSLSGETEAGAAWTQPCRRITWRTHRNYGQVAGGPRRPTEPDDRSSCLENPHPQSGISPLAASSRLSFTLNQYSIRLQLQPTLQPEQISEGYAPFAYSFFNVIAKIQWQVSKADLSQSLRARKWRGSGHRHASVAFVGRSHARSH